MKRLENEHDGIICLNCGWVGVSWSRHDYKSCSCPNSAIVDGGFDYFKRGARDLTKIQLIRIIPQQLAENPDDSDDNNEAA